MKKSKPIILILLLSILLIGCSESIPEGYYDYDQEKVEAAVSKLSFQPQLPQFVPIDVDFLVSDQYQDTVTESEALDVSFYTKDNDLLSIQFIEGEVNEDFLHPEKINLTEQVNAEYVDNMFAQVLLWQKDNITYKMTYRSSTVNDDQTNKDISKDNLVKVARSFHS